MPIRTFLVARRLHVRRERHECEPDLHRGVQCQFSVAPPQKGSPRQAIEHLARLLDPIELDREDPVQIRTRGSAKRRSERDNPKLKGKLRRDYARRAIATERMDDPIKGSTHTCTWTSAPRNRAGTRRKILAHNVIANH